MLFKPPLLLHLLLLNRLDLQESEYISTGLKSILRAASVDKVDLHVPILLPNCSSSVFVDQLLRPVRRDELYTAKHVNEPKIAAAALALNHYAIQVISCLLFPMTWSSSTCIVAYVVSQSWQYFERVKMTRGDATTPYWNTLRDANYFAKYDTNEVVDDELARKQASRG